MDNSDIALRIMTVAVVVSAMAMIAIAAMVVGIVRTVLTLKDQLGTFLPQVGALIKRMRAMAEANQGNLTAIAASAANVFGHLARVAGKSEEFANDASGRAKVQMERLELIGSDAAARVHHTIKRISGVVHPIFAILSMLSQSGFSGKHGLAWLLRRR